MTLPALAADGDPGELCAGEPDCTAEMRAVTEGYGSGSVAFAADEFSGFSGECRHLHPHYRPADVHHGAFVFERAAEGVTVTGLFSFYWPANPYAGLSGPELKRRLSAGAPPAPALLTGSELRLEFLSTASEIRYWFRADRASRRLFVIGRQIQDSFRSAVFCTLERHD